MYFPSCLCYSTQPLAYRHALRGLHQKLHYCGPFHHHFTRAVGNGLLQDNKYQRKGKQCNGCAIRHHNLSLQPVTTRSDTTRLLEWDVKIRHEITPQWCTWILLIGREPRNLSMLCWNSTVSPSDADITTQGGPCVLLPGEFFSVVDSDGPDCAMISIVSVLLSRQKEIADQVKHYLECSLQSVRWWPWQPNSQNTKDDYWVIGLILAYDQQTIEANSPRWRVYASAYAPTRKASTPYPFTLWSIALCLWMHNVAR